MKRQFFSVVIFLLIVAITSAQQVVENKKNEDEQNIFTKVTIEASTNRQAWAEHVRKNAQLPDSVLEIIPPGTYTVIVQFVVDKHGNVGQVKATNDPGYGLAKKAEKIVLTYKGTWQPANQCGRSVNAYKRQPITFIIPEVNNQPNL